MKLIKSILLAALALFSATLIACGGGDSQQSEQVVIETYSNPTQGLTVTIENKQKTTFKLNDSPQSAGFASCGSFNDLDFITEAVTVSDNITTDFPSEILESAEYCQLTWNNEQDSAVVVFEPQKEQQTTSSSYGSVDLNGESLTIDLNTASGESLAKEFAGVPTVVSCQYNGTSQQVQAKQVIDWTKTKQSTTLPVDLSGHATSCRVSKQNGDSSQETLFSFVENG
jgi:hypothetical protein